MDDEIASVGIETSWARGDHVHPTDTSRAPTSHASSDTAYGVGTSSNYGHVKLSDAIDSTSGTSGGIAATPAAVKAAYELAAGKQDPLAFDGTYNSSTNKAATESTVTDAINDLDVSNITGFGAGKTLASLSETNGKIAATFQDIAITKTQVSDFPINVSAFTNDAGYLTAYADTLVAQTAMDSSDVSYKLLTTTYAAPTSGNAYGAKYSTNLSYNPSTNKLSTVNMDLTGALNVTGNTHLYGASTIDSLTAGTLQVNGNSRFINDVAFTNIPTAPTADAGTSDTKLATTAFVANSIASLSTAMHFIGKATVAITDGSTTNPSISGYDFTADRKPGDVIIDKDNSYEYVWTLEGKWERLGPDGSYKTTQSAVDTGAATTNKWVSRIQQNANGEITATLSSLDTSGTWSGNATTATTASKLGSSTLGSATKPIYLSSGTATECDTYAGGTAVTLNGSSKGASTADFYAPAASGTANQILVSAGANTSPAWKATANGAAYATSANGELTFGTLPIAQGGTGSTSADDARTNLKARFAGKNFNPGNNTNPIYVITTKSIASSNSTGFINLQIIPYYATGSFISPIYIMTYWSNSTFTPASYFDPLNALESVTVQGIDGVAVFTIKPNKTYFEGIYLAYNSATSDNLITNITQTEPSGTKLPANPVVCTKKYVQLHKYAHINLSDGTADTTGSEELVLGNSTATGTVGNTFGRLALYSTGTSGQYLTATGSGWKNHVLPNSSGWVATGGNGSSTGAGSATQPVYLNSEGVLTSTTYSLEASVPSGAVFTDTTYSFVSGNGSFTVTPSGGSEQTVSIGTMPISQGGTGATDALNAITNLGGPSIVSAGTELASSDNVDSLTYGTFYAATSAKASPVQGTKPIANAGFKLYNIKGYNSSNYDIQLAFSSGQTARIRQRSGNSTWQDWFNIVRSNTSGIGSGTQPVYVNSSGVVTSTTYSLEASVPSGAVFTDTTYTFNTTAQTNKIQYKVTGASSWTDIPITVSITNNITGSGTSGSLAKFNGNNTITSGPALADSISSQTQTTKFLREDGTWAAPSYTTNMLPIYYQNLDFSTGEQTPGAYMMNGQTHPVTNVAEYGSVLSLPGISASTPYYAAQLIISSASGTSSPVHAYIRRETSGKAWSGWSTLLDDNNYKSYITSNIYWANVLTSDTAQYNTTPEVATIKLNGNTSASAASSLNVTLQYDSTLQTLNFVFA